MRPGMKLDVGHTVAVARGGQGSTLRLEHRSCNRADGHKIAREIARENKISASSDNRDDRERDRRERIEQRELERRARQRERRVIVAPDD
jgi:hypothetical protein